MKNPKKALIWITDILKKHKIPFQITGGLAAIAYGATRPLEDIDIDIPDDSFHLIREEVKPYIIYGPEIFKSDQWNILLMTLNYEGQEIDLSGVDYTYVLNYATKSWEKLIEDLSNAPFKKVLGIELPVIPYDKLCHYKKMLSRNVDLLDIQEIEKINQDKK